MISRSRNMQTQSYWCFFSPKQEFWDLAFRPFFLIASAFSVLAVVVWLLFLTGNLSVFSNNGINPVVWHIHEMLFGFAATCAMGFLLTAVQTWTGLRSANGIQLISLLVIWYGARMSLGYGMILTTMLFQAAWWLISIGILSILLIRANSRRNYQFIPLLSLLMSLNLGMLWAEYVGRTDIAMHIGRTVILLFGILVSIVGGRIIPLFTKNATGSKKIKSSTLLDLSLLILSMIGVGVFFIGQFTSLPFTPALIMIAAGGLHLFRLSRWDSFSTRSIPLLWSLHATYFCLGAGLILLGFSYFSTDVGFSNALHLIAVGTIGGMILAVICRVSLGHTGRPLATTPAINIAFFLILVSGLTRTGLPFFGLIQEAWMVSGLLWAVSFLLFVFHYWSVLLGPRQSK